MRTLLCLTLVALLQSGLGDVCKGICKSMSGKHQITKNVKSGDIKFNSTVLIRKPQASQHKVLLNLNAKLQDVFQDHSCQMCSDCMERAVRVHKVHSNKLSDRPMLVDLQKELLINRKNSVFRRMHKRDVKSDLNTTNKKAKKNKEGKKCKKNKHQKTVTVTKYATNNVTYALQVKEGNASGNSDTCQIYIVESVLPCNISEKDILLEIAKVKSNNKNEKEVKEENEKKKNKEHNENTEENDNKGRRSRSNDVSESNSETEQFEPRIIEDGQIPENVMSSVEDFF